MAKIEKIFFASIWLQFSKKLIRNLKKTFCYGVELLFLFDWAQTQLCRPSGYWVDLWAGRPNLRRFFGRRPISRPKIENFPRTKCFYFSILHTHTKFQASRFNNKKKKYPKVADPLKRTLVSKYDFFIPTSNCSYFKVMLIDWKFFSKNKDWLFLLLFSHSRWAEIFFFNFSTTKFGCSFEVFSLFVQFNISDFNCKLLSQDE